MTDHEGVVAEIRRAVAGAEPEAAQKAICVILSRLPGYDWVGFYVARPAERMLVLGPFVGEPTEHVRIPYGKGICGQTAESGRTFVVADVAQQSNYLACSVKVKSEIVVPVFKDGEFVAELDIDSHTPGAFTPKDRRMLEEVAALAAGLFQGGAGAPRV